MMKEFDFTSPFIQVHFFYLFFQTLSKKDELSFWTIRSHFQDPAKLESYFKNMLKTIELNSISKNPLQINTSTFKLLSKEFGKIYQNLSPKIQLLKEDKVQLIKIEQTIHTITEIKITQDISPYLSLLEETCDKKTILELITLLYYKYSRFGGAECSQIYLKWIYFLSPFLEYLEKIKFNFMEIMLLDSSQIQEICKEYLEKLQKLLEKRGIQWSFILKEEDQNDFKLIINDITNLKEKLIAEIITEKDTEFYYELGLCSFLIHLLNYDLKENQNFLNICFLVTSYIWKPIFPIETFKSLQPLVKPEEFKHIEWFNTLDGKKNEIDNYLVKSLEHLQFILNEKTMDKNER